MRLLYSARGPTARATAMLQAWNVGLCGLLVNTHTRRKVLIVRAKCVPACTPEKYRPFQTGPVAGVGGVADT